MDLTKVIDIRALNTCTDTGLTGSAFRSKFGNVASRELHKARRLCALHCWTGSHALSRSTVTQHITQLGSRSRPSGGKMVFGSRSRVPCWEPNRKKQCSRFHWMYDLLNLYKTDYITLLSWIQNFAILRGYCTPGQFCDYFYIFLRNYNTLITSKICFL